MPPSQLQRETGSGSHRRSLRQQARCIHPHRHHVINEQAGVDLAAELGHTNTKITIQHYIRRNEMVNPATAELLDRVLAKEGS